MWLSQNNRHKVELCLTVTSRSVFAPVKCPKQFTIIKPHQSVHPVDTAKDHNLKIPFCRPNASNEDFHWANAIAEPTAPTLLLRFSMPNGARWEEVILRKDNIIIKIANLSDLFQHWNC